MKAARGKPALIYDADCGFCRRWIARWSPSTGDRVRYLPYQRPGVVSAIVSRGRRASASPSSSSSPTVDVTRGAAAVFRTLLRSRSPWVRLAARGGLMRGVRHVAEAIYRYVAAHRSRVQPRRARRSDACSALPFPRGRLWLLLSRPGLALGGLGIVYVVAFTSLKRQVLGLYGARGILPIQSHLQDIDRAISIGRDGRRIDQRRIWWRRFRLVPSLLWLDASDAGLKRLCTVGQLAGAALALGIGGPWRTAGGGDRLGRLSVVCLGGARLPAVPVGRAAPRGWPAGGARQTAPPAHPHAGVPAAIRVRARQARLAETPPGAT